MYLGHVSGRKVVPDCRRLQIVGCKKDIPCVLASTLTECPIDPNFFICNQLGSQDARAPLDTHQSYTGHAG